ncbi:dynein regulatory complex protein 8 [Arctopsyche grandis]|uniref:dynein regulatory complex protein 8 n=1 Tax=Arctopsyche grandis TaxID=121162 RepID=UPI00406D6620
MASKETSKVIINNDLEKKIADAFEVFDHSGKQTVDVREIGTILRSLGCCPSEAEIQEVLLATEDKEATGSIHLANFLPYMIQKISEHRFYPADAETLLAAFKTLDEESKGYITKEKITKLIMEEGEQFTQEEYDEMMQIAVDPTTDTIPYEYYINQLMVEDDYLQDNSNKTTVTEK